MVDFSKGEIKDIMPHNLLTPESLAVSFSVGEAMRKLQQYSCAVSLYAQIDQVPDEVLDLMAAESGTQYYERSLPRKTKEQLIMQTLLWYMYAGTPSVLNEFLATVLDGGWIEEWMDYGGAPYHFKAYAKAIEDESLPLGKGTEIRSQLEVYKNIRSWLENFAIILQTKTSVNINTESKLKMQSEFYSRNNRQFLRMDAAWKLEGIYKLNGYKTADIELFPAKISALCDIEAGPYTESHLRIEKNLWYLDGTNQMDGKKLLNAEITEIEL